LRAIIASASPGQSQAYRMRDCAHGRYRCAHAGAGRGFRRQLAASASQPNRTADLRRITVPALVIHGLHDPLVAASGGLAVARAIPGSRFVGFSGMGHDLPRALWPEFVNQIAALAAPGEQRSGQGPPAG
jgi:pimeloyl-ACP methyl ester carboxylesterase